LQICPAIPQQTPGGALKAIAGVPAITLFHRGAEGERYRRTSRLRYSERVRGKGQVVLDHACRLGMEGVVSKRADGAYQQERPWQWLTVKCITWRESVIGGFTVQSQPGRLRKLKKHPWPGFFQLRQSITAKMQTALGV
jgi:hypothetical protein